MKKSLLGLLLAVALVLPVVPAFANDDSNLELIPKVGWLFTPEATFKHGSDKESTSKDSTFSVGADLFFDMENNLFLGFGLVWGNMNKFASNADNKMGFMNIYAALKYKVLVNGNEEVPVYLYPLVNLGIGVPSYEISPSPADYEMTPGFYWGVGAGVEFFNIILEAIYGCNYATEKFRNPNNIENDITYTAFRINVGYRFEL